MEDRGKNFRMQGKCFFLTYPKCDVTKEDCLRSLELKGDIEEYIICREKHQDETNHLHVYVKYRVKKDIKNNKYFDLEGQHGSYETVKNKFAVMKYVQKGDDYISNFDLKVKEDCRLNKKRDISRELMNGRALTEVVEDNPELLFGYKKLKEDINMYQMDKKIAYKGKRDNIWLWGLPGCGKSQWVERNYPNAYRKDQSKWWDGYQGAEVVVLEDLDSPALGHLIKILADNYACAGEVKGSKVPLMHQKFIITSNRLPSELWKEDEMMMRAIQRRFEFATTVGEYETGYELKKIIIQ